MNFSYPNGYKGRTFNVVFKNDPNGNGKLMFTKEEPGLHYVSCFLFQCSCLVLFQYCAFCSNWRLTVTVSALLAVVEGEGEGEDLILVMCLVDFSLACELYINRN